MGFEIKNICTVVPNPHYPKYLKPTEGFDYFSVFITPRLQFDGTLKEYYEILNWTDYITIFNYSYFKTDKTEKIDITHDLSFIKKMNIENIEILRKKLWKKLFKEDTPVEAWPIYVKPSPQKILVSVQEIEEVKEALNTYIGDLKDENKSMKSLSKETGLTSDLEAKISANNKKIEEFEEKKNKEKEIKEDIRKRKINEQYERNKINPEFHKKISALASYPHLLRILGFIHDFKVESKKIEKSATNIQFGIDVGRWVATEKVEFNKIDKKEFQKSVQFISPKTKIERNVVGKICASRRDEYKNIVQDGFILNTNNKRIIIDQDYLENSPLEIDSSPNNEKGKNSTTFNTKTFSKEDLDIIKLKTTESYISKGFSIKIFEQGSELLVNFDETLNSLTDETLNSLTDETIIKETPEFDGFEAHHLDCGYRIDVQEHKTGEWKSLNRRKANYYVDEETFIKEKINSITKFFDNKKPLLNGFEDEPWIEEVKQIGKLGEAERFEEIARWDNWSLSCHLFGAKPVENNEYNDIELENILPIGLPKLRFGETYNFRIRIADICGNGVPFEKQLTDKKYIVSDIFYKRREPISLPLFFPNEKLFDEVENTNNSIDEKGNKRKEKIINNYHFGEDNDTLVIRSVIGKDGIPVPLNKECVRYITPSLITQHLAEVSGVFESFKNGNEIDFKSLHEFLKTIPEDYYSDIILETGTPFVHDVALDGIELSIKDLEGKESIQFKKTKYGKLIPIKLILKYDENIYNTIDKSKLPMLNLDTTKNEISIEPGYEKDIQITTVANHSLKYFYDENLNSKIKKIKIVHATQKPVYSRIKLDKKDKNDSIKKNLIENDSVNLNLWITVQKVELDTNSTSEKKYQVELKSIKNDKGEPIENFKFPCLSSGEFRIIASFRDYKLNPDDDKGYTELLEEIVIQKPFINIESKEVAGEEIQTIKVNQDSNITDFLNKNQDFLHFYPDTKFRNAEYRIEAISRFAHYFHEDQISNQDNPFSIFGELRNQIIENSAKPSKPTITSIVPLFKITNSKVKNDNAYKFENNAYRIYLGPTWYETGLDEKIAVIHDKDISTTHEKTDENDSVYSKEKISIFANDPIDSVKTGESTLMNHEKMLDTLFIDNTNNPDTIRLNSQLFENTVENLIDKGENFGHSFSVFHVGWEKEVNQFYCDITLNSNALKNSSNLVKFALCRFQFHSIKSVHYDYRFSDVVMTDMVEVRPKKVIEYNLKQNQVSLKTKVEYTYAEKAYTPNEVWLICQNKLQINNNISQIEIGEHNNIKCIRLNEQTDGFILYEKEKLLDHDELFIEEYRNIRISGEVDVEKLHYNPRIDPQKELVFFYKLK